jgi:glucosamine-6-phosphate deaminase
MNLLVKSSYAALCQEVAARIARLVRDKPDAVLGLATGSTPIGVYAELVRLHRDEGLDFSRVATFNLDEYYPLAPDAPQSYVRFMREHLFDHINCANWRVPDGRPRESAEVERDCSAYETLIADAGGLDFQLLGIGRTGHIGFNEPGSPRDSRTRLVTLDHLTRADAAPDFFGLENVPVRAITMGIGTILEAREIAIMASGARKAAIVREALEGKITSKIPASLLRDYDQVTWCLDEAAAAGLSHYAEPWRSDAADFGDPDLRRRALIAIALENEKPLSRLTPADPEVERVARRVPSLAAAVQEVERDLTARLSDELHLPRAQRVLCLSPHPDDDVICCGATLLKMGAAGNELTVAYGVNGANAVRDKDVLALLRARHPRMVTYIEENAASDKSVDDVFNEVRQQIFEREPGAPDPPVLRELKRVVREGEAADGCRKMGARPVFLNLPFYGDGSGRSPVGDRDVALMLAALSEAQPHIVLLTGELSDPHGTHEMCAEAFERAAVLYLQAGGAPFARWFYRGAWDEFAVTETDYFSVFDKAHMERKTGLILDHVSQLDPVFPGSTDPREFYERARDRNRETARQLQTLGILPPSRSYAPLYVEAFQIKAPV